MALISSVVATAGRLQLYLALLRDIVPPQVLGVHRGILPVGLDLRHLPRSREGVQVASEADV